MKQSKYLLELSNEEAIILYNIIQHSKLYQSNYKSSKELVARITKIYKTIIEEL